MAAFGVEKPLVEGERKVFPCDDPCHNNSSPRLEHREGGEGLCITPVVLQHGIIILR